MVSVSKLFVIALIGVTLLTSVFAIDGKLGEEAKMALPAGETTFTYAFLNISPERGFVGTNFSFDSSESYCEYVGVSGKQCDLTNGVIDFGDSARINFNGAPGIFYHVYNKSGLYVVSLKVCHDGKCDRATRLLTVEKDRIEINVDRGVEGYEWAGVEFDGNATGSYSKIVEYAWDFDGDGTYDWVSNSTGKAYHVYNNSGIYHAVFKAVNAKGDYNTEMVHVKIMPNEKPLSVIKANSTNGTSPLTVLFNGSDSNDSDGEVKTWLWLFGDGTNASGEAAIHTFTSPGIYNVSLTVTDDKGANGTNSVLITVSLPSNSTNSTNSSNYTNQAPIANFTYTNSSYFAFSFIDLSSDPDGNVTSWFWDFGDGSTSTSQNPDHIYAQKTAVYNVALTVTDNNGSTSSYTQEIKVVKPVESSSPGGSYSGGGGGWVPPHKEENETNETIEVNETTSETNESNESIAPVQEEAQNKEEKHIVPAAASTQMTGLATGVFNDPTVTPLLTFLSITAMGLFAFGKIGLGEGTVSIRKWIKQKI